MEKNMHYSYSSSIEKKEVLLSGGQIATVQKFSRESGIITVICDEKELEFFLPVAFHRGEIIATDGATQILLLRSIEQYKIYYSRVEQLSDYRHFRHVVCSHLIDQFIINRSRPSKYELWEAIKEFQANWDMDSDNFCKMVEYSLHKASKLLQNDSWTPIIAIIALSKMPITREKTRFLLKDLFSYDGNGIDTIQVRTAKFIAGINKMVENDLNGNAVFYQDVQSASLLLFLKDPDNNYFCTNRIRCKMAHCDIKVIDQIDLVEYYHMCDCMVRDIKSHRGMPDFLRTEYLVQFDKDSDYKILACDILRSISSKDDRMERFGRKLINLPKRINNFD